MDCKLTPEEKAAVEHLRKTVANMQAAVEAVWQAIVRLGVEGGAVETIFVDAHGNEIVEQGPELWYAHPRKRHITPARQAIAGSE